MAKSRNQAAFAAGIVVLLLLSGRLDAANRIVHVSASATGLADGVTWANAYTDLQDALESALPGDEIWVAEGVYTPDRGTGNRRLSFAVADGVGIYGGFAGAETDRDQRDPVAHETVLSGDLLENDEFYDIGKSPCCQVEADNPACDDAECIARVAQATSGPIAGANCDLYWDARCAGFAQLYCCDLCRPTRCDNAETIVTAAPGVGATLDGLTIENGEQDDPESLGEDPTIGAGLAFRDADLALHNCVLRRNAALDAPAVWGYGGAIALRSCTFTENRDHGTRGPAMGVGPRELEVTDCVFVENEAGGLLSYGGSASITSSSFIRNLGTGLDIGGGPTTIRDCVFAENESLVGAGVYVSAGVSQFINCAFYRNSARDSGGGMEVSAGASAALINCVFVGNSARYHGGAVYAGFPITVLNSVFVGNVARWNGGLALGSASLYNSILWGNQDESGSGQNAQINNNQGPPRPTLHYCTVQGWTGDGLSGIGVVNVDPLFVDADGLDDIPGTEDDDFHLRADSPLIDAGNPEPPFPAFDFDHHARPLCGRVDTGAFEFGFGDYNCDRMLTRQDVTAWSFVCASSPGSTSYRRDACRAFDSDADKDVDLRDFADFTLLFSPASP